MAADDRIGKLRALLDRVKARAQSPRVVAVAAAVPAAPAVVAPPVVAVAEDDFSDLSDVGVVAAPVRAPTPARPPAAERAATPAAAPVVARPPAPTLAAGPVAAPASPPTPEPVPVAVPTPSPSPVEMVSAPEVEIGSVEIDVDVTEDDLDFADTEGGQDDLITIDDEEEAPESAPRPAGSIGEAIGEALSGAADAFSREAPLKTPPPESGRQEVVGPPSAPDEPIDVVLSGSAEILADRPVPKGPAVPTMEQLGELVELEGAELPLPPLELERTATPTPAPAAAPQRSATPVAVAAPAPRTPVVPPPVVAAPAQRPPLSPEIFARPAVPATPPAIIPPATAFEPKTFLELLDASLSL